MRTPTAKLIRYLVAGTALASAALSIGRVELLIVTAPIIVAVSFGLLFADEPDVDVAIDVDTDRCLEGEEVIVTVDVDGGRADVGADLAVRVPGGFEDTGDAYVSITLRRKRHEIRLPAARWGTYRVGHAGLRIFGPGRFVKWERVVDGSIPVKVFPRIEKIRNAPVPPDTQAHSGNYVSRRSGDGIEFAQVRVFQPGDRIRSVNWRVTTRRDELHVNVFHPERNADVVVFLDAFGDFGSAEIGSLELAVRGAGGLARRLLKSKDRVGLVSFGGVLRWIYASMGRTQIYRIIDTLLESQALFSYADKQIGTLPPRTLPPSATVVAFSPLIDERAVRAIEDLSERGFPLVVVDTLPEPLVPPEPSPEGVLAHRVWTLKRAADRSELSARGIPVLHWWESDRLDAALSGTPPLRRLRRSHA